MKSTFKDERQAETFLGIPFWELLHHGRRAGEEEKTEIRVVSGETNSIDHIETHQL